MVIVSNGFSKFHMAAAAAEADRRGILSAFLTGAYPCGILGGILSSSGLRGNAKLNRLIARREAISDDLVHPLSSAEGVYQFGMLLRSERICIDSFKLYGRQACRRIEEAARRGARIYHYRAGYGGRSLDVAKECGLITLCDYSIAHAAVLAALVENSGMMPAKGQAFAPSPFWKYILSDTEKADAVLVNSQFVYDTFEHAGHSSSPVYVIYQGIDDAFLSQIPEKRNTSSGLSLLFAGHFERRKGAEILVQALEDLDKESWSLEIAGGIEPGFAERHPRFFSDARVKHLGLLSRKELALAMSRANIFVFPTLAEGSARVVFEALAAGCYVITTPNAGSIVEDGVNGGLVPPGDSIRLADAIRSTTTKPSEVAEIGSRNALLVRANYRQCHYGDKLAALYRGLQSGRTGN
jgi:glycosyltransferase involved in cell wall biosynthesis